MTDIFKSDYQGKVDKQSFEWVGPPLRHDEVPVANARRLPDMCTTDNSVHHVERPRKGYDYSY